MHYKITTNTGALVIPSNHITGQALTDWMNANYDLCVEAGAEPSFQTVQLPNGRIVAYVVEIMSGPEEFERSFFQQNPSALKAGQPPPGLEWLNRATFDQSP